MNEELISFKTAKLAREKGFNLFTNVRYSDQDIGRSLLKIGQLSTLAGASLSAPRQSILQKWIREEHGIDICILGSLKNYYCGIYGLEKELPMYIYNFKIYENALETALYEALKLIK